jgi:hypothetical protein
MASKKQPVLDPRDYEAAPAPEPVDVDSVAHQFVLVEGEEKPQPVSLITPEEQKRRDLKARFKKIYGYKPVVKDLDELRRMVETAEHQQQLKRDGVI